MTAISCSRQIWFLGNGWGFFAGVADVSGVGVLDVADCFGVHPKVLRATMIQHRAGKCRVFTSVLVTRVSI